MRTELFYSNNSLDRGHLLREMSMEELMVSEGSLIYPVWRSRNLFELSNGQARVVSFTPAELPEKSDRLIFLGKYDDQSVFAADYSSHHSAELTWLGPGRQFVEVRRLITQISNEEASLLAYARGMMTWHRNHMFCGKCGSKTRSQSNGHERKCTNPGCGKTAYPRVDPAVIVLIEHTFENGSEKCLLGRTDRYPSGMYSTLAGFVEPGESLEMTVKREMMEEVGLEVSNIRYIASQPWPFPTSLMLGFYATAKTTEVRLEEDEVAEVRWFSRQELHKLSQKGEIEFSRVDSIARHLITTWMRKE